MASSPWLVFNRLRCTNTQGGQESGVCASSGSVVAPLVARISTECGVIVVVLTLTRIIKSVVTGQAPVTLE